MTGRGRCLAVGAGPFHDAYEDVLSGLAARGWEVERHAFEWSPPAVSGRWRVLQEHLPHRPAALRALSGAAQRAGRELRDVVRVSAWFDQVERALATRGPRDVALVYIDQAPVGLARLAARMPARTVAISLVALSREWRQRAPLALLRALAPSVSGAEPHADHLRPCAVPCQVPVVCPSESWRDALAATPLTPPSCTVIPFGVEVPAEMPVRSHRPGDDADLVWVGRLSPEKGLHLFLPALALARRVRRLRLSVIAAPGPAAYARALAAQIDELGLADVVRMEGAVERPELRQRFAHADALLFHSVFGEPVAQVMLHAAASGLPVVGPASMDTRSLLQDEVTATCYGTHSAEAVADAVLRGLASAEARRARAERLYIAVRDHHNLADTVARYDALLCERAGASLRSMDSAA